MTIGVKRRVARHYRASTTYTSFFEALAKCLSMPIPLVSYRRVKKRVQGPDDLRSQCGGLKAEGNLPRSVRKLVCSRPRHAICLMPQSIADPESLRVLQDTYSHQHYYQHVNQHPVLRLSCPCIFRNFELLSGSCVSVATSLVIAHALRILGLITCACAAYHEEHSGRLLQACRLDVTADSLLTLNTSSQSQGRSLERRCPCHHNSPRRA